MSLWGSRDGVALSGEATIANANTKLVGANTAFESELYVGAVITLDDGQRFRIVGIVDDEEATVSPAATADESDSSIDISDTPTYVDPRANVHLITTAAAQDANNRADGIVTPGWTQYSEYTAGAGGTITRRKVETLVAFKGQPS